MIDQETLLMAGKIWVHLYECREPLIVVNGVKVTELRIVNNYAKSILDYEVHAFDPTEKDFIRKSLNVDLTHCVVQLTSYETRNGERHPRAKFTTFSKQRLINLCVQIATK
jgi:hypothetical protein